MRNFDSCLAHKIVDSGRFSLDLPALLFGALILDYSYGF